MAALARRVPTIRCGLFQAALVAMAMVLFFVVSSNALERFLIAQASADLQRLQRGESRVALEFAGLEDVISGAAEGATRLHASGGLIYAQVPDGKANFRINLGSAQIDARRFTRLRARLYSSTQARLTLIVHAVGEQRQHATDLHLNAGWNELDVDLSERSFTALAPDADGTEHVSVAWGGRSGRIDELRLYLAADGALDVRLDYLRFAAPGSAPGDDVLRQIRWLGPSSANAAELLRPDPETEQPFGLLLPLWQHRPETLLAARWRARQANPEVPVWPASQSVPQTPADLWEPRLPWELPWWLVAVYGLALALARWRSRGRTPVAAALDLALGLVAVAALTLGLVGGQRAAPQTLVALAMALAYMLSRSDFAGAAWWGTGAALRQVMAYTMGPLLVLLAIGLSLDHLAWPGPQRLLGYLPFVVLQQLLLLGFLLPHARRLWPAQAPLLAAFLFALMHAPNFGLMVLSLIAAWFWCTLLLKARAIAPIMLSHYLLGSAAIVCLPPSLLLSAEVGMRYFLVH